VGRPKCLNKTGPYYLATPLRE